MRNIWPPICTGAILILVMIVVRMGIQGLSCTKANKAEVLDPQFAGELKRTVEGVLRSHQTSWNVQSKRPDGIESWQIRVPAGLPIPSLHLAIQDSIRRVGAHILFAESEPVAKRVTLRIGQADSCLLVLSLSQGESVRQEMGKIALIIDDFGERWDRTSEAFLGLNAEITVSVLPGRRMSSRVASELLRRGAEILLHLPMEPLDFQFKDDGYIVLSEMGRTAIRRVIQRGLDDVPGAVGVNNHMGSRATADPRVMEDVLLEIKRKGLYFIDSRTTASTVAFETARRLGVRSGERDVFVDAENDGEAIQRRMQELAREARKSGFAIGIGHCHQTLLDVLRQEIPRLQEAGYRFVSASDVLR